jgi:hypothetical protein
VRQPAGDRRIGDNRMGTIAVGNRQRQRILTGAAVLLGRSGVAACEADAKRMRKPLVVVLAAPQDAINATTTLQLAVYTLVPVLPVVLATMPLAELSARLLKLVF